MAPFNKRQIGYIQAIAGRQQHVTLISGHRNDIISSAPSMDVKFRPQTIDTDLVEFHSGQSLAATNAKSLILYNYLLDDMELCHSSKPEHNNDVFTTADLQNLTYQSRGWGTSVPLHCFDAPVTGTHGITGAGTLTSAAEGVADGEVLRNPDHVSSLQRVTPDGYLNSTTVKFRFTLPGKTPSSQGLDNHAANHPMGQDHYEFRWIVWRSKRPTFRYDAQSSDADSANMDMIRQGASFRNPAYDFFMGQTGRKRGFLGYTYHPELDKDKFTNEDLSDERTERYSGAYLADGINVGDGWQTNTDAAKIPSSEAKFTVDDLLTMPINKTDYVVMKDVRFFLGKEHGKSHFEDTLHWDWNDPIDTPSDNVLTSPTLNDKSYRWHMTLLGTTNGPTPCVINSCVRWTTKMESG